MPRSCSLESDCFYLRESHLRWKKRKDAPPSAPETPLPRLAASARCMWLGPERTVWRRSVSPGVAGHRPRGPREPRPPARTAVRARGRGVGGGGERTPVPSGQPSGLPGEDGHQTEGGRAASRLCLHVSFYGKCLVLRLGLWPGRIWLVLCLFNCEAHALISRLARRGPWPPPGRWNGTGRGGHEGGGPRAGPQPVTSWREALGPLPPSPASHGPLFPLCFLKPHWPFWCQISQDFPADPSSLVWGLGHWIWRVRNPRGYGSHIFAHPAPTRPDRLGRVSASALSLGRPHLGEHPPPVPERPLPPAPFVDAVGRDEEGNGTCTPFTWSL